jgi:hypothetical protein
MVNDPLVISRTMGSHEFQYLNVKMCRHNLLTRLNQRGAFTVHWPPSAALEVAEIPYMPGSANLSALIIPATLKRELRAHLDDYGFSDEFIYPDADGVANHVNWKTWEMVERKRRKREKI